MTTYSYSAEDVVKDGHVRVKTSILGGILTVIPTINRFWRDTVTVWQNIVMFNYQQIYRLNVFPEIAVFVAVS